MASPWFFGRLFGVILIVTLLHHFSRCKTLAVSALTDEPESALGLKTRLRHEADEVEELLNHVIRDVGIVIEPLEADA